MFDQPRSAFDRLFARAYGCSEHYLGPKLDPHREYLADDLNGVVLDLGCGTGATFPYLAGADVTVYGVDPSPAMRRRASTRATELGLDSTIVDGRGESLPFCDDEFDAAIVSLVLCSVERPAAVIDELVRVLRPGGELRILEHVRDDGTRARVQRLLEPAWRVVAHGCHLTRDPSGLLAGHPTLDVLDLERFDPGVPVARPFVRGRFRHRRAVR